MIDTFQVSCGSIRGARVEEQQGRIIKGLKNLQEPLSNAPFIQGQLTELLGSC